MEISEPKSLIQKEQINLKKNLLKDKNKIQELEYDELNNNLGYNSKYQASNIILKEKRNYSNEKEKSATNSSSNENENEKIDCCQNENNLYNRKMSSPIYLYYEGFDKYLSKNSGLFDYEKSNNYIEKDLFFNNQYNKFRTHSFNDFQNNNIRNNIIGNSNNIKNNNEVYSKKENNIENRTYNVKNKIPFSIQYYPIYYITNYNEKEINGIQSQMSSNNYNQISYINNLNLINYSNNNNLYNNSYKKNNYNIERKKVKQFKGRNGDWICLNCQNLNFAFRLICNRCHYSKVENLINNN